MANLTKQQKEQALLLQLEEIKKELEFLNDSDEFYEFNLGTGKKSVLIPDFKTDSGIYITQSDEIAKLDQPWYKNYAGFRAEEEAVAIQTFNYLKAWLKLQKIHSSMYPALYSSSGLGQPDFTQTAANSYKWVIAYNKVDNYFYPTNAGATNSPDILTTNFYFRGSANATGFSEFATDFLAYSGTSWPSLGSPEHEYWSIDAWIAIKFMFGPEGSDSELRDLFQIKNIAQTRTL